MSETKPPTPDPQPSDPDPKKIGEGEPSGSPDPLLEQYRRAQRNLLEEWQDPSPLRELLQTPGGARDIARTCGDRFLAKYKLETIFEESKDQSRLRDIVLELMRDPTLALGAIFEITLYESRQGWENTNPNFTSIMERTHDLVTLLANMCQGRNEVAGRARLQTLLRYMLETNYQQTTEAAETLVSTMGAADLAVDLGCGPGKSLSILEQKAKQVVGIDINPLPSFRDERIRLGVIDASQKKLFEAQGGREQLSFVELFGKADVVFASLVIDRVANQYELLQNCSRLLKQGGTLGLALLLPVNPIDDDVNVKNPLHYVVEPLTAGEDAEMDFGLIKTQLETFGLENVILIPIPTKDPVTGRPYDNHHLITAKKIVRENTPDAQSVS